MTTAQTVLGAIVLGITLSVTNAACLHVYHAISTRRLRKRMREDQVMFPMAMPPPYSMRDDILKTYSDPEVTKALRKAIGIQTEKEKFEDEAESGEDL